MRRKEADDVAEVTRALEFESGRHDAMPEWMAQNFPPREAAVLAASQNPILSTAFDECVSEAAWHRKP